MSEIPSVSKTAISPAISKVAIAGLGLIGTSFALALRRAGFAGEIAGVSSRRSIEAALARGAIDREGSIAGADLVMLSQPIGGILRTLGDIGPWLKPGALVTDVGSTKRRICEAAGALAPAEFLGGHPMAGREQRGAEAADPALFEDRPWILAREPQTPAALEFAEWLRRIGARAVVMDPAEHDRLAAWSSHLPQLISTSLASLLAERRPDAARAAGPGLRDMTRIAAGSWDIWADIFETNGDEIQSALTAYILKLQSVTPHLQADFERGSAFAKSLRQGS